MSEQWLGLHNADQHERIAGTLAACSCSDCGFCHPGWFCRCCLAAEVETLRAQVQRVRGKVDDFAFTGWVPTSDITDALDGTDV